MDATAGGKLVIQRIRVGLQRSLLIVALVTGCSQPGAAPGVQATQADYTLRGRIDWEGTYRVAVAITDLCQGMTVSLIDPGKENQPTVSTSYSSPDCTFSMVFSGGFVPLGGRVFLLEAIKGLDGNRNGSDAIRLRTFIKFAGGWQAITGPDIKISPGSVAVALIQSDAMARGLTDGTQNPDNLIGAITAYDSPYDSVRSPLDTPTFQTVVDRVRSALSANADPVHSVAYKDGSWVATLPTAPVVATVIPDIAVAGAPITIVGRNFTGVTSVVVNGKTCVIATTPAPTDNNITVTLPLDATSGSLVVSTPNGPSIPLAYTVLPQIAGKYNPDNQ